jgi:hypothetical protein
LARHCDQLAKFDVENSDMKAVTLVGATPNRIAILYDVLADLAPDGIDREHLSALVGPSNLARLADAGEDNAFSDCLNAGEELGLFQLTDGTVRLMESNGNRLSFLSLAEIRVVEAPETTNVTTGWLAGAIAWMLCQDPRQPLPWGGSAATMRLKKDLGGGLNFGMTNDSRYQQAVYWAKALGYVDRISSPEDAVIPDPTPAVLRRLPLLLPEDGQRPIRSFLSGLALNCPVLDGGRLRAEVEAASGVVREPFVLSSSLSLALLRLKHRGELRLDYLDDAQAVFVDGLDGGRASHVTRLKG